MSVDRADEPLPASLAELIRRFMEDDIPFNRWLGIRLREVRHGFAHLVLPFRDELVGDPTRPALHGGTISTVADTVGGAAVFSVIEAGARCSTIDLRVDYLRPGRLQDLNAQATVLRVGNRVAVASIQVFHDDPAKPIAAAMGVYAVKRAHPAS